MLDIFTWFYGGGIRGFLRIWKNYLAFIWYYFSIIPLLKTLLSPWRRDISFSNWRGLHPILFLQKLLNNIFSRVMGMIVRLAVIIFGLLLEIIAVFFGLLLFILWVVFPLALVASLILIIDLKGDIFFWLCSIGLLVFLLFYGLVIIRAFFFARQKDLADLSPEELAAEKWFIRVWNRMGFAAENPEIKNAFSDPESLIGQLAKIHLNPEDLEKIINWERYQEETKRRKARFWEREQLFSAMPVGRYWSFGYTVHLDRHARDLQSNSRIINDESHLMGHQKDIAMAELILTRPTQSNLLIVGDPGVGKTTFINYLAKEINQQKANQYLNAKRFVEIDLGTLARQSSNEAMETELERIFYEAAFAGNVILVVHDIHEFLSPENKKLDVNLSKILTDFLAVPSFQMIATATRQGYHNWIERNPGITKNMDTLIFEELSPEETVGALLWWITDREKGGVVATYQALKRIAELSNQYVSTAPMPEKAIDALEETLLSWGQSPDSQFLTREKVEEFFSQKYKVPVGKVGKAEKEKLINLEEILHQRVVGQNEAIREISEAMRRVRSGIGDSKKPVGSFLFLGPTGVGKTETAKALAQAYFGDEERMIRFDMSEFQTAESLDRFQGSEQRNEPSQLITKVSENPFSVLLFDEIEKAHPDILNLMLQILDEGWLTDVFGKKASFSNAIIIATSNAGAALIKEGMEQGIVGQALYKKLIADLIHNGTFRPEFLNRFDKVVLFGSLNQNELLEATRIALLAIAERIYKSKRIKINFADDVIAKIIEKGYDPVFGMRSVKRFAQDTIEDSVAKNLLAGTWSEGAEVQFSAADLNFN